MNNKKAVLFCAFGLTTMLFGGCASSQKTASAGNGKGCNMAQAGDATMRLTAIESSAVSGASLPRVYTVFKATGEKAFFEAAKKQNGTAMLMLPSGCKTFRVSLSETMSPELAQRYPNLISLKGNSADGADLHLDWDGAQMRGQVLADGKSYLLEPSIATNGGTAYLLFDKADVTTPRQPFEQRKPLRNGADQLKMERQRSVPQPTR